MKGKYFDSQTRKLIFYLGVIENRPVDYVKRFIAEMTSQDISEKYLSWLILKMKSNNDFLQSYVLGPLLHSGRSRKLGQFEINYLLYKLSRQRTLSVKGLTARFNLEFYGSDHNLFQEAPSISTIYRTLQRCDYSNKVVELRNIRQNPLLRLEFLESIKHVEYNRLIDIDETPTNEEEFIQKYGWSRRGERAVIPQFVLGDKRYSVMAAYTPYGFLYWEIIEGSSFNGESFVSFLGRLSRLIRVDFHFAIVDNASIHKTDDSLHALDETFNGLYLFVAPYSPDMKPIELGFSLVKAYLCELERLHPFDIHDNPIHFINDAFQRFSITGQCGHLASNHFSLYKANHNQYMEELNLTI